MKSLFKKSLVLVLLVSIFYIVAGSVAVKKNTAEAECSALDEGQCSAANIGQAPKISEKLKSEASEVLDEAARIRKETAETVVKDDETQRETDEDVDGYVPGKDWEAFEKVMQNAAKQWVEGDGERKLSAAAQRAVEQVQKRKAGAAVDGADTAAGDKESTKTTQVTMADIEHLEANAGDSEIVLLTKALARLAARNETDNDDTAALSDLELVDYLCHSADNGKHLASIGGVQLLLKLARGGTMIAAVRALATCAQNNSPVIETAVINDAIGLLVGLARGNTEVIATSLRALVALRTGTSVQKRLLERQKEVVVLLQRVLRFDVDGKNERRAILRSLALLEQVLKLNPKMWEPVLEEAGVMKLCAAAMRSDDVDVRESAAGVIKVVANGRSM